MPRIFDRPASFLKGHQTVSGPKARWVMLEAGELPAYAAVNMGARERNSRGDEWTAGLSGAQALEMTATGDLAAVPDSDKYLSQFERLDIAAERRVWIDDIAGAIPNVPAFIAGHPLNMRRRTRHQDDSAPLAIIYSITSSASIGVETLRKRGAVALALVRVLAARRPVELWTLSTLDADSNTNASYIAVRIDTAPMDLARAAHFMTNAGHARLVMHGITFKVHRGVGAWPYGMYRGAPTAIEADCRRAFEWAQDILFIPPALLSDPLITKPEQWLRSAIARYAPGAELF